MEHCNYCKAKIHRTELIHGYKIVFRDNGIEPKFCSLDCMDRWAKRNGIKKYYYVAF